MDVTARVWVASVLTVVTLSACSDERDRQQKVLLGILSWTASAEMIVEARSDATVPETYSRLAIRRCQEEVALLAEDLGEKPPQTIRNIQSLLDQAGVAASRDDRPAVERALQALRDARGEIQREMSNG